MGVRIEAVTEVDWERWRELRLRMLTDTPTAFGETAEHARGQDEAQWRERVRRTSAPGHLARVAVDEATGAWVGTMSARTTPGEGLFLVAVFVDASVRGGGVAAALLRAVLAWAGEQPGADALRLHVHEDNLRAQAFYRRHGFVDTGVRVPHRLDPTRQELEMVAPLGAGGAGPTGPVPGSSDPGAHPA